MDFGGLEPVSLPLNKPLCLNVLLWFFAQYQFLCRYEGVIAGQFFGHRHFDLIEIFYDLNNFQRPISVAYAAPSVTTYSKLNPGYRIYEIDGFYQNSSWVGHL